MPRRIYCRTYLTQVWYNTSFPGRLHFAQPSLPAPPQAHAHSAQASGNPTHVVRASDPLIHKQPKPPSRTRRVHLNNRHDRQRRGGMIRWYPYPPIPTRQLLTLTTDAPGVLARRRRRRPHCPRRRGVGPRRGAAFPNRGRPTLCPETAPRSDRGHGHGRGRGPGRDRGRWCRRVPCPCPCPCGYGWSGLSAPVREAKLAVCAWR